MRWRFLTRGERLEITLLTISLVAGWAAVGWLVIEELCR